MQYSDQIYGGNQYNTSFYISTDYGNNWYLYNKITNNEIINNNSRYTPQLPTDSFLSGDGNLLYVIYDNSLPYTSLEVFNITVGNNSNPLRYSNVNIYLQNPTASYNGSIVLGINLITNLCPFIIYIFRIKRTAISGFWICIYIYFIWKELVSSE